MTYITSIERLGIEKGIEQGIEQGILQKGREDVIEVLQIRFGNIPQPLVDTVNTVDDPGALKKLRQQAVTIETLEKFEQLLNDLKASPEDQTHLGS